MFRLEPAPDRVRLVLDRPRARNAIPAAAWAELEARLGEAEAAGAPLLVLEGAGGAFCAGADLSDFPALRDDPAARAGLRLSMRAALGRLRGLACPTVAFVDGACYGIGVALALACDLRVAGPKARFAVTPAKLGLSYPQEDVRRLVALVGPGQAARLLFTAAAIDGAEAVAIGLAEQAADSSDAIAAAIAGNDPASLAELKRVLRLVESESPADPGSDARFDALFGSAALARRLEALRRK